MTVHGIKNRGFEAHRLPFCLFYYFRVGLLHVKCYGDSVFFCFCLFICLLVGFCFVLFCFFKVELLHDID